MKARRLPSKAKAEEMVEIVMTVKQAKELKSRLESEFDIEDDRDDDDENEVFYDIHDALLEIVPTEIEKFDLFKKAINGIIDNCESQLRSVKRGYATPEGKAGECITLCLSEIRARFITHFVEISPDDESVVRLPTGRNSDENDC